jgi:hypothetical protein
MRRLLTLLLAAVAGGGAVHTAFQYHVVRTEQTFLLIPKKRADWREAYVDVRGWSHTEWLSHAELSQNVSAAGHGDLVIRSGAGDFFRGLFESR